MEQMEKILAVIYRAVDEVNEGLAEDEQMEKSPSTALYGKASKLDSLGLVNLIVSAEQELADEFDVTITLADEKAMSQKNSPFLSIESLANYVASLLEEGAASEGEKCA